MRTSLVIPTICLLFLGSQLGCVSRQESDDEEGAHAPPVVSVETARITVADVEAVVMATGKTDALRKEKVVAPIAGTIVALPVLGGTIVKSGDVIAVLVPRESQAAIVGAEAMLRTAVDEGQRREAERALNLARSAQNKVFVRASAGGVVGSRSVTPGELVQENAELATIVDLASVAFFADIALRDIGSVHEGLLAEVRFPGLADRAFPACVASILPRVESESQTVTLRLEFRVLSSQARGLLRTEMTGMARIVVGIHRNVLLVPKSALLRNDETNSYTVVVVTRDSLSRIVPVAVGVVTDSVVEVASPLLGSGQPVVTVGNYALADSTKVLVGAGSER